MSQHKATIAVGARTKHEQIHDQEIPELKPPRHYENRLEPASTQAMTPSSSAADLKFNAPRNLTPQQRAMGCAMEPKRSFQR